VKKEDIDRPEPGTLPPRISFVEQMGGSAGYYVRFKDIPSEGSPEEVGPIRKYVPILQYDSQDEALQAAIEYRDQKAKELDVPITPERFPHSGEAREKMSDSHNRLGLRGLGLTFTWQNGTAYPELSVMWSEEGGQKKVSRGMTSRGLLGTMKELAPHLEKHLHPGVPEEKLIERGAEGTARLLIKIAESAETDSQKRGRIKSLLERWMEEDPRDRDLLENLWAID